MFDHKRTTSTSAILMHNYGVMDHYFKKIAKHLDDVGSSSSSGIITGDRAGSLSVSSTPATIQSGSASHRPSVDEDNIMLDNNLSSQSQNNSKQQLEPLPRSIRESTLFHGGIDTHKMSKELLEMLDEDNNNNNNIDDEYPVESPSHSFESHFSQRQQKQQMMMTAITNKQEALRMRQQLSHQQSMSTQQQSEQASQQGSSGASHRQLEKVGDFLQQHRGSLTPQQRQSLEQMLIQGQQQHPQQQQQGRSNSCSSTNPNRNNNVGIRLQAQQQYQQMQIAQLQQQLQQQEQQTNMRQKNAHTTSCKPSVSSIVTQQQMMQQNQLHILQQQNVSGIQQGQVATSSFRPIIVGSYGGGGGGGGCGGNNSLLVPMTDDVTTTTTATATTRILPIYITIPPKQKKDNKFDTNYYYGGVSDAALIYTKYAIESIIISLNNKRSRMMNKRGKNGKQSLTTADAAADDDDDVDDQYTVRDLSTCIGAWDLTNSTTIRAGKIRHVTTTAVEENNMNDGNPDTAFKYYYERTCPILLNTKSSSSLDSLPYCVEDFLDDYYTGSNDDDDDDESPLPIVAGAIVLTYGADLKFTGGIGEEGVITKATVEFLFDAAVVYRDYDSGKTNSETMTAGVIYENDQISQEIDLDATIKAEELLFASSILGGGDHESSSSLIRAALCALSPITFTSSANDVSTKVISSSSADDGVYIPTIWSGNTDRIYQYCLNENLNDRESKRLGVAITQNKKVEQGDDMGPTKGVCRITLSLSAASVLAKKKMMAEEAASDLEGMSDNGVSLFSTCSEVHRKIRKFVRILRPPLIVANDSSGELGKSKRQRLAVRRQSKMQRIDPAEIVVGVQCEHELLLDTAETGKVYINGVLAVSCCSESAGSLNQMGIDALSAHTLFGIDFTIPSIDGKRFNVGLSSLPNKMILEKEYGILLIDALINAGDCDVAQKILDRLITGTIEQTKDTDDDAYPIEFDNLTKPCLESIVLLSTVADPIGICAKALGTKFRLQYGVEAFPCEVETNEEYLLRRELGARRVPKMVPRRARDVLFRGGYARIDQIVKFLWVGKGEDAPVDDHNNTKRYIDAIEAGMKLLTKANCVDVDPNKIKFVSRHRFESTENGRGLRSWYDSSSEIFYVSDAIFYIEDDTTTADHTNTDNITPVPRPVSSEDAAFLLALHIAKDHPDMMLEIFIMSHRSV